MNNTAYKLTPLTDDAIRCAARLVLLARHQAGAEGFARWQHWRTAMEKLYGTQRGAEQVHAQLNEAVKNKGDTVESLAADVNKLPAELQQPTVAAAMLYLKLDVKADAAFTRVLHRQQAVAEQLLQLLRLTPVQRLELEYKVSELQAARMQAEGKTLTLKPTLRLLATNLSIILLLLIFWRNQFIDDVVFGGFTVWVILATPIIASLRLRSLHRKLGKLLSVENIIVPTLRLSISPWHYTFWFLHTLLAVALIVQLIKDDESAIWSAIFFMPLFGYLLYSTLQNSYPWPTPELVETYLAQSGKEEPTQLNADENDEHLAVLTVKLKGLNQRIEAFVLEAALFGALAFSAFVQLISTDLLTLSDITVFLQHLSGLSSSILHLQPPAEWADLAAMGDKKNLFSAICMLTLFCSLFFLTVIATRLRFSDLGQRIDTALELARAYNTKEETVLYGTPPIEGRAAQLEGLGRRVHLELAKARILFADSEGVMVLMRYFRDLGVGTFFVILTTSSLIFNPLLATGFAALYLFTRAYFYLASIRQQIQLLWLRTEELYLRYKLLFTYGPWVLLLLAYLLVLFELPGSKDVTVLSLILLGIVQAFPAFLPKLMDSSRSAETSINFKNKRFWKRVDLLIGFSQLLIFLGLGLKTLHLPFGNELLIIGFGNLSVSYIVLGFRPQGTQPWTIIIAWVIASASVGVLFKILRFSGANEMLVIGTATGGVVCFLGILGIALHRRLIENQFLRHSIFFFVLNFLILFTPFFFVWENASLGWHTVNHMLKRQNDLDKIIDECNLKQQANPACVMPKAQAYFINYRDTGPDSVFYVREKFVSNRYYHEMLQLAWYVQDETRDTANMKFSLQLFQHVSDLYKENEMQLSLGEKNLAALAAYRLGDTNAARSFLSLSAVDYDDLHGIDDKASARFTAAVKEMHEKLGIKNTPN